jgi:hypothetical protein
MAIVIEMGTEIDTFLGFNPEFTPAGVWNYDPPSLKA